MRVEDQSALDGPSSQQMPCCLSRRIPNLAKELLDLPPDRQTFERDLIGRLVVVFLEGGREYGQVTKVADFSMLYGLLRLREGSPTQDQLMAISCQTVGIELIRRLSGESDGRFINAVQVPGSGLHCWIDNRASGLCLCAAVRLQLSELREGQLVMAPTSIGQLHLDFATGDGEIKLFGDESFSEWLGDACQEDPNQEVVLGEPTEPNESYWDYFGSVSAWFYPPTDDENQ